MNLRFRIFLLCCPLLLIPIGQYWFLSQGVRGFVSEIGTVVGAEQTLCPQGKRDPFPADCWYSVVEYKIDGAHKGRLRSEHPAGRPDIGDVVPILVNPNNRHDAVLSGIRGYWSSLFLVSILSLAFLLFAAVAAFFIPGV